MVGVWSHVYGLLVCRVQKFEVSLAPHNLFSFLAFTYVGAMVASNSALSYISYPTQVKSNTIVGALTHRDQPKVVLFLEVKKCVMGNDHFGTF